MNSGNKLLLTFIGLCISCSAGKKIFIIDKSSIQKYEIAYQSITNKKNNYRPFLDKFNSDAVGVKIIPRIFQLKNYSIYNTEYFKFENSIENNNIKLLSKKYSNSKWRKDKNFRVLMQSEMKNFHGPLEYVYFSEIKNDSLRAEILGNPFAEYSMTTGEHYLIIFENNYIKSVEKTIGNYD